MNDTALLIVDMQVGLFYGEPQPYAKQRVLANIKQLIQRAKQADIPIFVARHTGPPNSPIAAGSPNWQVLPELGLDERNSVMFDKTKPSCFYGTSLTALLQTANISHLVIAGMKTQYCIDTTCRFAAELGFAPVLVADAHTCMDTEALSAAAIVEHHNATLRGAFVELLETADVHIG